MRIGLLFRLLSFVLLCIGSTLYGKAANVPTDTSTVLVERQVKDQKLAQLRSLEKYHFNNYQAEELSLWERLKFKLKIWLEEHFFNHVSKNQKGISYLIIAIVLVFVIMQLAGIDVLGLFKKRNESIAIPYEQLSENIHELAFPSLIQQAVREQNYRQATRLHYLQALKILSERQLIHWQKDKTNRSYVYELSSESLQKSFEQLTTEFEYIWYGNFGIDLETFSIVEQHFNHFNRSITDAQLSK